MDEHEGSLQCFHMSFICHLSTANSKEISPCKHDTNRKCGCKDGYYKKKLDDVEWECSPCKKCGPGQFKTGECKFLKLN